MSYHLGTSKATPCQIDINKIQNEENFAHVSCRPEHFQSENQYFVGELTVCIFNCKYVNRRYKHHCRSDGTWDLIPGTKTCDLNALQKCSSPHEAWSDWVWSCPEISSGTKCNGNLSLLTIE